MEFFLIHHDPSLLPEPLDIKLTRGERWVFLGGSRYFLSNGPRRDRLDSLAFGKDGVGPRWLVVPFVWRPYCPSAALGHGEDPIYFLFWVLEPRNLVLEKDGSRIDPDNADQLIYLAHTFEKIAESLRATAPLLFFLRDGDRVRPTKPNYENLTRPSTVNLTINKIQVFQRAALDNVAFVAWWTLTFRGWEDALEDWEVEIVRSCEFLEREKRGCFINLLTHYQLANFELWVEHGVPFYYPWTEALHHDPRFTRANPDVLREYFQIRQEITDEDEFQKEIRGHFLRTGRGAVFEYDNFFQEHSLRALFEDTPALDYEPSNLYVLQAFQGYRPYPVKDRPMADRLLARFEVAFLPDSSPPKVAIVRWAPRCLYKGAPGDEGYTVDYGDFEYGMEERFPGRSFDQETGWVSSDLLMMRELFKVAFAPKPGEAFTPGGILTRDSLATTSSFILRYEEKCVLEAVQKGRDRPPALEEFFYWERNDFFEKEREIERGRNALASLGGCDLPERSPSPRRHPSPPTPPPDLRDMPELLRRMTFPNYHAMKTPQERGSWTRRGRLGSPYAGQSQSGSASTTGRLRGAASRRSASPVRGARLADPTKLQEEVLRPGDQEFESVEAVLLSHLSQLFEIMCKEYKRKSDEKRAPTVSWVRTVIERGYIHITDYVDALRVFLYSVCIRELKSPAEMLDYLIERGIRFVIYLPRDPIPPAPPGIQQHEPSKDSYPSLQGKSGGAIFRTWEGNLQAPMWAKTHFPAFIQQGGVIGYFTRHYANAKLRSDAGQGVSLETRVFTRHTSTLPDTDDPTMYVHDEVYEEETEFFLGTTPNPVNHQANPKHAFPPSPAFDCEEWNLGSGEWTDWEEDFISEVIQLWRLGKMAPKSVNEWHAAMRVHRNNIAKVRGLRLRDACCPNSSGAEKWCRLLKEFYGFPLRTCKISSLATHPEPVRLRRFM